MNSNPSFKYDVAFSFLSSDLSLAQALAADLEPTVSTFVYDRRKEELLGSDGMDRFAEVFGHEARLTVILYRDDWGSTPWTAFEETHIKTRALQTRMTSFMVINLEETEPPLWVPETHLYASTSTESHADLIAIIRVRARQQGATLRTETAVEYGIRRKRDQNAAATREKRRRSPAAVAELRAEIDSLFGQIKEAATSLKDSDSTIDIDAGSFEFDCAITSPWFSISLQWKQPLSNTILNAMLRVNFWKGPVKVPSVNQQSAGASWDRAIHYVPQISKHDEWVWRHDPSHNVNHYGDRGIIFLRASADAFRTQELADHLLRRFFEKAIPKDVD